MGQTLDADRDSYRGVTQHLKSISDQQRLRSFETSACQVTYKMITSPSTQCDLRYDPLENYFTIILAKKPQNCLIRATLRAANHFHLLQCLPFPQSRRRLFSSQSQFMCLSTEFLHEIIIIVEKAEE